MFTELILQTKNFKLKEGVGQRALYNVLKVYSIMDPEVGYCQGMSFLSAMLVTHLNETDAFWVLVSLLKGYNLRGLFMHNLPLLKHYLFRFYYLVYSYMPELARHLEAESVRPLYYCAEWFSTLYSYNVPMVVTARIWDVLLFEGPEFLFRVGLAILKTVEEDLLKQNFDNIMLLLKSKAANLDVSIIGIAEKFTGLTELLDKIDKKFLRERDTILSDDGMMEKPPPEIKPAPEWKENKPEQLEKLGRQIGMGKTKVIERDYENETPTADTKNND